MALNSIGLGRRGSDQAERIEYISAREAKRQRNQRKQAQLEALKLLKDRLGKNPHFFWFYPPRDFILSIVNNPHLKALHQNSDVTPLYFAKEYSFVLTCMLQFLFGDLTRDMKDFFICLVDESIENSAMLGIVLQILLKNVKTFRPKKPELKEILTGVLQHQDVMSQLRLVVCQRDPTQQEKQSIVSRIKDLVHELCVKIKNQRAGNDALYCADFSSLVSRINRSSYRLLWRLPFSPYIRMSLSKFSDDGDVNALFITRLFDLSKPLSAADRWHALSQFDEQTDSNFYSYITTQWLRHLGAKTGKPNTVVKSLLERRANDLSKDEWHALTVFLIDMGCNNPDGEVEASVYRTLFPLLISIIEEGDQSSRLNNVWRGYFDQVQAGDSVRDMHQCFFLLVDLVDLVDLDELLFSSPVRSAEDIEIIMAFSRLKYNDDIAPLYRAYSQLSVLEGYNFDNFLSMLNDPSKRSDYKLVVLLLEKDDQFSLDDIQYVDPMMAYLLMPLIEHQENFEYTNLLLSPVQLRTLNAAGSSMQVRLAFIVSLFHADNFTAEGDPRCEEFDVPYLINLLLDSAHGRLLSPWFMTNVWSVISIDYCNRPFIDYLSNQVGKQGWRSNISMMMKTISLASNYMPAKDEVAGFNSSHHDYSIDMDKHQLAPLTEFWALHADSRLRPEGVTALRRQFNQ